MLITFVGCCFPTCFHFPRAKFLRGAADEAPNEEPGDVIVVIEEKKHDTFERSGSDIVMEKVSDEETGMCQVVNHTPSLNMLTEVSLFISLPT